MIFIDIDINLDEFLLFVPLTNYQSQQGQPTYLRTVQFVRVVSAITKSEHCKSQYMYMYRFYVHMENKIISLYIRMSHLPDLFQHLYLCRQCSRAM